ncbi:MAG: bifunctional UDP-N-acetylglucosamine diphosphorylase/glucosamine-1-phosphate N-acetyltransferase GlmU, partial [Myxococcales bacterium]|nr:bifunctional UDP-N-acetylglucosamine diphosphorylase/glucosamine-1-phosphate N-acetyltransferase GlmU [Myxococcales bacterium]
MTTTAIVLAAGQGTRMKSSSPKVLHAVAGRPMVDWILHTAFAAGADDAVVVVGYGRDAVAAHLRDAFGDRVRIAVQEEQNGTGHAVACAMPSVEADAVMILYGDTPLLVAADLERVTQLRAETKRPMALLTCRVQDPTGYGRILRRDGSVVGIVEHRDASEAQRAIDEINPGVYVADTAFLRRALSELRPDNDQGELYLTDVIAMAAEGDGVADALADAATLVGVNDRAQLAEVEATMYQRIADGWRREGVTIRQGARIEAEVQVGRDARIEHGVVLRGKTQIGEGAVLDVGCVLDDVEVAARAYLKPYTVATASTVGEDAQVGPFSHLRPDSHIGPEAHVGNFVETKKTRLHRGAKANHLAYLGDGEIGEAANVGAGTIFCNYDGFSKHKTTIEAGAFIGSDSQLVAPITIGAGAYVATGTTVTQDVPADALAIARTRQDNKLGYAPRLKARLLAAKKA